MQPYITNRGEKGQTCPSPGSHCSIQTQHTHVFVHAFTLAVPVFPKSIISLNVKTRIQSSITNTHLPPFVSTWSCLLCCKPGCLPHPRLFKDLVIIVNKIFNFITAGLRHGLLISIYTRLIKLNKRFIHKCNDMILMAAIMNKP